MARTINKMAEDLSESFQQLRDQTNHLEQIFTSLGEGIVAVDRHGEITQYNDRIYTVFGLDRDYQAHTKPRNFLQEDRIDDFFTEAIHEKK